MKLFLATILFLLLGFSPVFATNCGGWDNTTYKGTFKGFGATNTLVVSSLKQTSTGCSAVVTYAVGKKGSFLGRVDKNISAIIKGSHLSFRTSEGDPTTYKIHSGGAVSGTWHGKSEKDTMILKRK